MKKTRVKKTATKILVRIIGSKPKVMAPYASDLVLFEFSKTRRGLDFDGFRAVTQKQLDDLRPTGNGRTDLSIGGWRSVTPAERDQLIKLARSNAPFWRSVKAEVG